MSKSLESLIEERIIEIEIEKSKFDLENEKERLREIAHLNEIRERILAYWKKEYDLVDTASLKLYVSLRGYEEFYAILKVGESEISFSGVFRLQQLTLNEGDQDCVFKSWFSRPNSTLGSFYRTNNLIDALIWAEYGTLTPIIAKEENLDF